MSALRPPSSNPHLDEVPSTHDADLMLSYGESLAAYRGEGTLTLADGREQACKFQAGQLRDGSVVLLCYFPGASLWVLHEAAPTAFHGTSDAGEIATIEQPLTEWNYLPASPSQEAPATYTAYLVRELQVHRPDQSSAVQARFGLTNFSVLVPVGCDLRFTLSASSVPVSVSIRPLPDYSQRMSRLRTLKGTDLTCEAIVEFDGTNDLDELNSVITHLCCLLSVARGTKVQWVYRDLYGSGEQLLSRTHYHHVTKPYCMLHTIDPVAGWRDLEPFIDHTYPVYLQRHDSWQLRSIVDAYLDAKAEGDFLEMRGVKLAVVLEIVKFLFLRQNDAPIGEFSLDQTAFKRLRKEFESSISRLAQDPNLDDEVRGAIEANQARLREKLGELRRSSFREIIEHLCTYIGLDAGADLDIVKNSRNSLVHTGEFYCRKAKEAEKCSHEALTDEVCEWRFLLGFIDKLILKLLGYSGPYVDWQPAEGPIRREQI
jgi:hypothetical protein